LVLVHHLTTIFPNIDTFETCLSLNQNVTSFFSKSKAENFLGAVAVVHASGFSIEDIFAHMDKLTNVPGRFELVGRTPKGKLKDVF
jgi:UDP-N-acetylmuramyl pentapeptide synthase